MSWATDQLRTGIKPAAVLKELIRLGFDPKKNPHFTQQLLKQFPSQGGSTPHRAFDFWKAISDGNLRWAEWFVYGGTKIDAEKLDRHQRVTTTPLLLASRHGHVEIVEFLLQQVEKIDPERI